MTRKKTEEPKAKDYLALVSVKYTNGHFKREHKACSFDTDGEAASWGAAKVRECEGLDTIDRAWAHVYALHF